MSTYFPARRRFGSLGTGAPADRAPVRTASGQGASRQSVTRVAARSSPARPPGRVVRRRRRQPRPEPRPANQTTAQDPKPGRGNPRKTATFHHLSENTKGLDHCDITRVMTHLLRQHSIQVTPSLTFYFSRKRRISTVTPLLLSHFRSRKICCAPLITSQAIPQATRPGKAELLAGSTRNSPSRQPTQNISSIRSRSDNPNPSRKRKPAASMTPPADGRTATPRRADSLSGQPRPEPQSQGPPNHDPRL